MAKYRATINYRNGDRELRFYWTDSLTKEDIIHLIFDRDPRCDQIQSFKVDYDETYKQTELAGEISAIVDVYKAKFSERLTRAFKLR